MPLLDHKEYVMQKMKYNTEHALDLDTRVIYIFGELTEDIGTLLRIRYNIIKQWWNLVEEKEFSEIHLDISSFGGSIYAVNGALDFYHELNQEGVKVNTRAQGICMSAATVILSGATGERSSYPRCRFMLHDVQIDGVGGTANQVQSTAKNISDEQMELFSLYAQFSRRGKPELNEKDLLKETKKWLKRFTKDGSDFYISAKEARELNLIDRIL
jgi:ATP-dependent protease ClpP protease subunit